MTGVSRSATIVIAYLMTITDLSYIECINAVRAARSVVDPNPGFRKQLEKYGETILNEVYEIF